MTSLKPSSSTETIISLFAERPPHLSVPLDGPPAAARSAGQGRPLGRRLGALPLRGASTVADWMSAGRMVIFASMLLYGVSLPVVPAHAQPAAIAPSSPQADFSNPFGRFIAEASQRFGVPAAWIRAVMSVESGGDQRAVSPAGAMGLMQIMPSTWADLRVRYGLGSDSFDPRDNILAGAAFLREMHDRYGSPGFLAAYNCGPDCYDDHLATGRALPPETVAYVAELLPLLRNSDATLATLGPVSAAIPWTQAPLFVHHFQGVTSAARLLSVTPLNGGQASVPVQDLSTIEPQSGGLFVALSAAGKVP